MHTQLAEEIDTSEISSKIMKVSPSQAAKWLEVNTRNRTLNKARVQMIARDIREGRWQQRNVAIAFYEDGRLADGQHRLAAIADAGLTCKCRVESGYSLGTKFDDNRARKWSDDAHMSGERSTIVLGAALKVIHCYVYDVRRSEKVSNMELDEILEVFPAIRESITTSISLPARLRGAAFPAFHLVTSLIRPKQETALSEFFQGLKDGAGMEKGHPVLGLREKIMQMQEKEWRGVRSNTEIMWNTLLSGWEFFQSGVESPRYYMKVEQNGFKEIPGATRERLLGMIRKNREGK